MRKKIILTLLLAVLLMILAGCGVDISTTLESNDKFEGTRVTTIDFSGSDSGFSSSENEWVFEKNGDGATIEKAFNKFVSVYGDGDEKMELNYSKEEASKTLFHSYGDVSIAYDISPLLLNSSSKVKFVASSGTFGKIKFDFNDGRFAKSDTRELYQSDFVSFRVSTLNIIAPIIIILVLLIAAIVLFILFKRKKLRLSDVKNMAQVGAGGLKTVGATVAATATAAANVATNVASNVAANAAAAINNAVNAGDGTAIASVAGTGETVLNSGETNKTYDIPEANLI